MSLQFVMGASGSGKSHYLYEYVIKDSMEHPSKNYIVLVPEQFTMQTQKELVMRHPRKGIMNIDVVSFQRLAYHVFDELGADNRIVLEETGKSLILRKIAGKNKELLKVLGGNLKKPGYIQEVKSVISEFIQYDIGVQELEGIIANTAHNPALQLKMQDISLIYKEFKDYLKEDYITSEELLAVLTNMIGNSKKVRGSVIVMDGFTGFTPIQNKLLAELMKIAEKIVITVTLDGSENAYSFQGEHQLFHMSKKTIQTIAEIAKETRTLKEKDIILKAEVSKRYEHNPPLAHLEKNLFRSKNSCFPEKQEELQIHAARNPAAELEFSAGEIKRLVREKGMRYQQFAIITGDVEIYRPYAEEIFKKYEIPVFMDYKRNIMMNPFIEYIRSALLAVYQNFTYESMFRFLKSGLSGLEEEQTDLLENYVLALGIRGKKRWFEKWTRKIKEMPEEELQNLNITREQAVSQFQELADLRRKRNATVTDWTKALYLFIERGNIQMRLKQYENYFLEIGNGALAKEYAQIYRIVMELLDKLVSLLGNEIISLREFTEVLDAGFEEAKVGIIPPSVDQVVLGDLERTRLNHIKVLFFVGVNDGIIPKSKSRGGILSELDREELVKQKVELAPTKRQQSYIERFYLYLALTKPADKLYLSYSKVNMDGKSLRGAYLIYAIQRLYKILNIIDEEERQQEGLKQIVTAESGIDCLVAGLRAYREGRRNEEWCTLFQWYLESEEWKEKVIKLGDACFYSNREQGIGKAAAHALYGKILENSVTRLEQYAACSFAHFLKYGLKLSERTAYQFAAIDMGNIFHEALERFSGKLQKNHLTWFDVPDDVQEKLIIEAVDECVTDYGNTVLYSSFRNEHMIQRMKRILKRTVWALCEQIRKGKFVPSNYEVSFAMQDDLNAVNIALSEDEKLKLKGRIDRLDLCEEEKQVYVKVIDYKSGNTAFDLAAFYYGLQLQLVVYMNAAVELEKKKNPQKDIIPAGIFYYNIKDPLLSGKEEESTEEINERILKELRMNGLVNQEEKVIEMFDRDFVKDSSVIPVSKKKDGSFTVHSPVASSEQFQILSDYVNKKMKELGKEILNGQAEVNPYELDGNTACAYCIYQSVCGIDKKIPGYHMRSFQKLDDSKVWEKLKRERYGDKNGDDMDERPAKGH